jgi:hypothetical protein
MLLIALEKQLRLLARLRRIHAIHSGRAARGNVKPARRVEGHVPYVARFRVALVAGCTVVGLRCRRRIACLRCIKNHRRLLVVQLRRGARIELVHLPARHRRNIQGAVGPKPHHLHAEVLRLEQREGLAVLSSTRSTVGRRPRAQVSRAALVRRHRPHKRRRRGQRLAQRRALQQSGHRSQSPRPAACPSQTLRSAIGSTGGCPGRNSGRCCDQRQQRREKACEANDREFMWEEATMLPLSLLERAALRGIVPGQRRYRRPLRSQPRREIG